MENNRIISIIVPVYNSEKFIRDSLDSIVNQTYKKLEIILVNDGSTDKSGNICEEYASKDERIKVIHQKNLGQAAARNSAFESSTGDFIAYVDSDDVISSNYIEVLVELQKKIDADIVQVEHIKFKGSYLKLKNICNDLEWEAHNSSSALNRVCYLKSYAMGPWCKLIKRYLMQSWYFPEKTGYEDYAVMYKVIGDAKKLIYSSEVVYYYRQHDDSTMHTTFNEKKIDRILIADQLKQYINDYYPENSTAVLTRYCLAQLQLLMELPFEIQYKEVKKKAYSNIKQYRKKMLKDKKAPVKFKIMVSASYLGPTIIMILGRIYMKVTRR